VFGRLSLAQGFALRSIGFQGEGAEPGGEGKGGQDFVSNFLDFAIEAGVATIRS
jgi:hypothetical protein